MFKLKINESMNVNARDMYTNMLGNLGFLADFNNLDDIVRYAEVQDIYGDDYDNDFNNYWYDDFADGIEAVAKSHHYNKYYFGDDWAHKTGNIDVFYSDNINKVIQYLYNNTNLSKNEINKMLTKVSY